MDLSEYISTQYSIIVIVVLFFNYILDLLLSQDSWDREVGEGDRQGEMQFFFWLKFCFTI